MQQELIVCQTEKSRLEEYYQFQLQHSALYQKHLQINNSAENSADVDCSINKSVDESESILEKSSIGDSNVDDISTEFQAIISVIHENNKV